MPDPHPGQVIQIDSDSGFEEEVTAESFQQYRQDIASIRLRARNNQLSRRQRREEGAARERNKGGSSGENLPMNDFGSSVDIVPTRDQTRRRATPVDRFGSLTSRGGRSARGLPPTGVYTPTEQRSTRRNAGNDNDSNQGTYVVNHLTTTRPTRDNDNDIDMLASEPRSLQSLLRLSASPEIIDHDLSRTPDARTRRVEQREEELQRWERRLDEREREVRRREQAVSLRELRVAQRERKRDEFAELRQRQLDELRTMAQRHQEDIRRL
jgi:hypothetical protein